jgi:large subunit ribosomal protein L9
MKVLLIRDVYKLGRAGDVKKVADGYGRNYLIPQGLAVLATSGALNQAKNIRESADIKRAALNQEMGGIAEMLSNLTLTFAAKAGETDKLYGSITSQMVVDAVKEKLGIELNRRQVDHEPIRTLGTHTVNVRLTIDLIPKITIIVHREGEAVGPAKEIQAEVSTQADSEEPPADSLYEEEETAELLAETGVEE